eukprot:5165541-Amphidinium_carterae.1
MRFLAGNQFEGKPLWQVAFPMNSLRASLNSVMHCIEFVKAPMRMSVSLRGVCKKASCAGSLATLAQRQRK